jgi:hypothetical protein
MSNTSSSSNDCRCVVLWFNQLRGVLDDSCGDSEDGGGVAGRRPWLGRALESTHDRPMHIVYCSGGSGAVECSARLDLSMDFGAPIFSLSDGDVEDGIVSASASEAKCSESRIR